MDSNQNVELIYGENNNYHPAGNAYLEFDITVQITAGNFTVASVIRITNNAFAFCFKEAFSPTTGRSYLQHNKFVGQLSTILRLLTSKGSDLSSCFDRIGENALDNKNPLKQILINNQGIEANKRKIKGQLPLEHIFGFCKTFKKITKNLGIHLTFKMNDFQDIIFTIVATDINVTINSLNLYVPYINSKYSNTSIL